MLIFLVVGFFAGFLFGMFALALVVPTNQPHVTWKPITNVLPIVRPIVRKTEEIPRIVPPPLVWDHAPGNRARSWHRAYARHDDDSWLL